jgi:uncharacterized Zn finger protein (UPF0148 family)
MTQATQQDMGVSDLIPCQCGSKLSPQHMALEMCQDFKSPRWNKKQSRIWCPKCGSTMIKDRPAEAIEAWNNRTATPTPDCVERVARIIAENEGKNPDAMSHNSFSWWRHYVPHARAVLALRTVTPAPEWQGMAKAPEAIIRDLVLWINTNAKHLPEGKKLGIQDYMKRMGIQGFPFRAALPVAPIKDTAK